MKQEQDYQAGVYQQQPATEILTTQVKYAGFWIRWVANFIDGLVLIIPNAILGLIVKLATFGTIQTILASISGLLVSWIYFVLMTNKYQATIGKKALGLVVISDKSENLTLGQIILRETIGKLISMIILLIGYMMAGFTKRKQALHDKIASTLVVYRDPNKKVTIWVIVFAIVVSLLFLTAIIGILGSIFLVSLNGARRKAQDTSLKATVSSIIPNAIIYQDENGSYLGYKIPADLKIIECSGEPIINVSTDGQSMAIFSKLCSDEKKYFCADVSGSQYIEVDDSYAKSGAAICDPSNISEKSLENDKDMPAKNDSISLSNTFKDDFLGYEIKYPNGWVQEKEIDKENEIISIIFLPDKASSSVTLYIQSIENQQSITTQELNTFIKSLQGDLVDAKGKTYDEKDFVYTFADGTTSTGKAFKAEYPNNGMNVKQWFIAVPSGKKLYLLAYASDINNYDTNYNIALSMLNSWKIFK